MLSSTGRPNPSSHDAKTVASAACEEFAQFVVADVAEQYDVRLGRQLSISAFSSSNPARRPTIVSWIGRLACVLRRH